MHRARAVVSRRVLVPTSVAAIMAIAGHCNAGVAVVESAATSSRTARMDALLVDLAQLPFDTREAACDAIFGVARHAAPVACFAPGTPDLVVNAWTQAMNRARDMNPRFQPSVRWQATAFDGASEGIAGTPTVISYSFVPDGTIVRAEFSQPDRPSDLFAFMNGLYGSEQTWQDLYHEMFRRWGEVSGITFVFEPNDDGARLVEEPGIAGVRGDMRLSGAAIDGPGGILAYNYYPQSGDMVIDTSDTYWAPRLGNRSRTLRNVIAHEAGHGLGMAHVCPVTTTKLMEPFVTDVFDGQRHDDVRHAQYWYGDSVEPNDGPASAWPLGVIGRCDTTIFGEVQGATTPFSSLFAVNSVDDADWFSFTIDAARTLTVSAKPVGYSYDDSPQACSQNTGSCCDGNVIDSLRLGSLSVAVFAANGSTQLATATAAVPGEAASVTLEDLPSGSYRCRVTTADFLLEPQGYLLAMAGDVSSGAVGFQPQAPVSAAPWQATPVVVQVAAGSSAPVLASMRLNFRTDGGAFQQVPMVASGPGQFTAEIPPLTCGETCEYFASVSLANGDVVYSTCSAPAAGHLLRAGQVATVFEDSFATNLGWSVVNTAVSDGGWERGQPAGDWYRGDPLVDAGGDGWCLLTGNRPGNSDLDGGPTVATSPAFSLAGYTQATVSFERWFANNNGDADAMWVEVSNNNGASWVEIDRTGDTAGWSQRQVTLEGILPFTAQMRLRVSATDNPNNSVVEAGFDSVRVDAVGCVVPCAADFNQDGGVDGGDIEAFFLVWQEGMARADVNQDGGVDGGDIEAFFLVWQNGGC